MIPPEEAPEELDPFEDDEPLSCGIENPAYCESCT